MRNSRKELLYLLIPVSIIAIIICLFLGVKHILFSENEPKLDIYKVIDSPDKKYKAFYYNIDEGMSVSNYDHIAIKDKSFIITDNIEEFMPYSDRVFSIDNNHSSIDFFWESNSCLVIKYDYKEVKTFNIKEDVFTKWTSTESNESPVINIKYIDK